MAIISNLVARLSVDHAAFDKGMATGRTSLRGLAEESARANTRMAGLAAGLTKAVAAAGGLYGLKRAFTAVYREASGFETGMSKIATMLETTDMRMLPGFEKDIRRMSIAYGEATSSLSQGAMDIIGSAIAPSKAMGVLENSTIAAKAGFTTTATVVKALVGILNAYGMDATRAKDVSDILFTTVKNGVVSFEELAHGIGMVTGLSAVLGVNLEAVGASVATMTQAGINADIAITALRAILNTFMNPTEAAVKAAEELGFALDSNSIKGAGLVTVMEKLRAANAEQLEALMPNVRGLAGFASMLKNTTGLAENYQSMLHSTGATLEAFAKVQDDASFAQDRAAKAWGRLKVAMGDVFLGDVTAKMNAFADAVQYNDTLIQRLVRTALAANAPLKNLFPGVKDTLSKLTPSLREGAEFKLSQNADWAVVQRMWPKMTGEEQESFRRAYGSRDMTYAEPFGWTPAKRYEFTPTRPPKEMDYGLFPGPKHTAAARSDAEYAQRLARAYARSARVQADVRRGIEAQVAAATPAAAEAVAAPKPLSKEETKFAKAYERELSSLRLETEMLGKSNIERERAVMLRNMENEAMSLGVEFSAAQRAELEAAWANYEKQQKMVELGQIAGLGLVDSMRQVTNAVIQGASAWEALRGVALNVIANIQEALVWKPLEGALTQFATGAIGSIFGGGGGFFGLFGGGGNAAANAAGDAQKLIEASAGRSYGASILHGGGIAGYGGTTRMVSAGAFAGAPRFHLGADEVPSILRRGERVTSTGGLAAERRAFSEMISLLRALVRKDTNVHVYAADPQQYIRSRAGEQEIMRHVTRNQGV